MEHHSTSNPHRSSSSPSTTMKEEEEDDDEQQQQQNINLNPTTLFTNFLSLLYDIIYALFLSLSSPIFSLLSLASESFHRAEEAKDDVVDSAVHAAASAIPHGGAVILRKLAYGILGAVYVGFILTVAMVVAIVLGVGVVHLWVDEPVFLRERLDFDYSMEHPAAVFYFGDGGGGGGGFNVYDKRLGGVPVGHTFYVTLVLLMPESDFNTQIGMFQLTTELVSINGNVMAKSSHPCMLRFRSFPIRLVRTFLMGIPLLLGITSETQKLIIPMLKHREGYPRTKSIKITLLPRAKTSFLPELYQAEILLKSELPWSKELVHKWKWSFYVWTSLYIYIMILIALFCCFRPLVFPGIAGRSTSGQPEASEEAPQRSREVSESLRRWQLSRSKRKAMVMSGVLGTETSVSSSASTTTTVTRDDASASGDDVGDSELVSFRD